MGQIAITCTPLAPSLATVEINPRVPATIVAPAQVWLEAINYSGLAALATFPGADDYVGALHEYYHTWTVNGQPLDPWSAPENMPSAFNNPNKMYGKRVCFVFPEPGTYTVTLIVKDKNGKTATSTTSNIVVQDPDVVYSGNKTWVVAADGNFTGAPAGHVPYTSLAAAWTAVGASSHNKRILLKRGETYPGVNMKLFNSGDEIGFIGAWGDPEDPRPIIQDGNFQQTGSSVTGTQTIIADIEFLGSWNPVTESGVAVYDRAIDLLNTIANGKTFTFHNLKISGYQTGLEMGFNGLGTNAMKNIYCVFHDSVIDGWQNYGMLISGHDLGSMAVQGCRIVQKVDAPNGGGLSNSFKAWGLKNAHGPMRFTNIGRGHITGNDLFSRNGWSNATPGTADQDCLRLFVSESPQLVQDAQVDRNVMEGGEQFINMKIASESFGFPLNVVIENNLFIGTAKSLSGILNTYRLGITLRSNYAFFPAVQRYVQGGSTVKFFGIRIGGAGVGTDGNEDHPFITYSNTVFGEMSAAQDTRTRTWFSNIDNAPNVFHENNFWHQPNGTTVNDEGPVTSAMIDNVTTRYKGVRFSFKCWYSMDFSADVGAKANGESFVIPYAELTQDLEDDSSLGDNTTDQAYWETYLGPDSMMYVADTGNGMHNFSAAADDFTAVPGPTGITITNTSGTSWLDGKVSVHLDRWAAVPPMDTTYDSSGRSVPLIRPASGSVAYQSATSGRVTPDDLLFGQRSTPRSKGALEPA